MLRWMQRRRGSVDDVITRKFLRCIYYRWSNYHVYRHSELLQIHDQYIVLVIHDLTLSSFNSKYLALIWHLILHYKRYSLDSIWVLSLFQICSWSFSSALPSFTFLSLQCLSLLMITPVILVDSIELDMVIIVIVEHRWAIMTIIRGSIRNSFVTYIVYTHIYIQDTKAPSTKSTKEPSVKSTKQPSVDSVKSTKQPSVKSTKQPSAKGSKGGKSSTFADSRADRKSVV